MFWKSQCIEQSVSDELDVSLHQAFVHSNERNTETLGPELLLDRYSFLDQIENCAILRLDLDQCEQMTSKVCVESFISTVVNIKVSHYLLISSFEKVSPGIRPRFFNQKMAANAPEKKIPSTAAKAHSRSGKVASLSEIHFKAQSAFFLIDGTRYQIIRSLTSINSIKEELPVGSVLDVGIDQGRVHLSRKLGMRSRIPLSGHSPS